MILRKNKCTKFARNLFAKIVQRNQTATLPNDFCRYRTLRVVTHRYGMTYT